MLVREGVRIDEDRLTHAVLGLMRYLPTELWFSAFIKELRKSNPSAMAILDIAYDPNIQLWPSYLIPEKWKHAFWRPLPRKGDPTVPKGSICPDALITTDKWIMFVESEYSHNLDSEQMFQQFAVASIKRKDKEFFVLLINPALMRPSYCGKDSRNLRKPEAGICPGDTLEKFISECCRRSLELQFTEDDVRQRLLWINWQTLYKSFREFCYDSDTRFIDLPEGFKRMIELMRSDVCELLEKEDLVPISFDIRDKLSILSIKPQLVPSIPTIKPIIQFLKHATIQLRFIPQWRQRPDILKTFRAMTLCPEHIPKPLFKERF
jgi:hypothetical protein